MKKRFLAGLAALIPTVPLLHADVLLSEIRIDNGSDDVEYFELYNNGDAAVDLNGYSLLVIGDGPGGSGSLDDAIFLDGLTIAAGGTLLVGDAAVTAIEVDADGSGSFTTVTPDFNDALNFENSDNVTFALVTGYTGGTNDDLDADDDGTLELDPAVTVIDAVSLVESVGSGDAIYATSLGGVDVGPNGIFVPAHVFRTGSTGPWFIGVFGNIGTGSVEGAQRIETNADSLFDSPGLVNPIVETGSLTLSLDVSSAVESSGATVTATVTRLDDNSAPITSGEFIVNIATSDASEATSAVATVTIPDGQSSATFTIDPLDDPLPDGDQTVTFTVSALGFADGTADLIVTDDATDTAILAINEVHYTIDETGGDANGDGTVNVTRNGNDQFIEIINISTSAIDLTGYILQDQFSIDRDISIHEFREGTILAPGCAIVVFGGDGVVAGHTAAFGEAEVQISTNGGLFLDSVGDNLVLKDANGLEAASVSLPDQSAETTTGSFQLATDGVLTSGYVRHSTVGTGGSLFSPGTRADGSVFCDITDAISLSPSLTSVGEDAGFGAFIVTASIPSALTYDLPVSLVSSDTTELIPVDFPAPVIEAGQTSVDIEVDAEDDDAVDGTQTVTLSAFASGFLNSSVNIDVTDDGDVPLVFSDSIVINEIDSDQPGTDEAEFIELYNTSDEAQSLDNLYLVFVNGNNDTSYAAIDLTGNTIPANGYFVVGSTGLNPDLELSTSPQNGADAIALYGGDFFSYTGNTVLAQLPNTLLDSVVYGSNDPDDTELLNFFGPTEGQRNDTQDGSIGRIANGTGDFTETTPTPGSENMAASTGSAFGTWAAANGGSATTDAANDDDGDMIPAIVEYALGLSLSAQNALPAPVASGSTATITFPKGAEAAADSAITYGIQVREDLTTGDWSDATVVTETTSEISATIPDYPSGKGFARIVIIEAN